MFGVRQPHPATQPPRADFTDAEAHAIAGIAAAQGWQMAAHDHMRSLRHTAYRQAIDEYRAQLRFLLPLTPASRVLQLRCGWGAVALNLASCAASVVALDDRTNRLRFVAARGAERSTTSLHPVRGSPAAGLPFGNQTFDAALVLDAFEQVGTTHAANWRTAQQALLSEVRRVLRPGGWLLLGIANRLGFARPRADAPQHLRTYWSYHSALRRAGFRDLQAHAPLPSHQEPFWILPLDRPRLMDHFVDRMLKDQDYHGKLEARGLGSAYRIGLALWHVGRSLGLTPLLRYVVPSYLIMARK